MNNKHYALWIVLCIVSAAAGVSAGRADCDGCNPNIPGPGQKGAGTTSYIQQWRSLEPTFFILSTNSKEMVRISLADGSIIYGENYKPDEAARIFWDAIGRNMPKECK